MEPNDSNDERQPRNIRNQPFAWQDKKTLTMIAEIFDATNDVNSARSVYVALTHKGTRLRPSAKLSELPSAPTMIGARNICIFLRSYVRDRAIEDFPR